MYPVDYGSALHIVKDLLHYYVHSQHMPLWSAACVMVNISMGCLPELDIWITCVLRSMLLGVLDRTGLLMGVFRNFLAIYIFEPVIWWQRAKICIILNGWGQTCLTLSHDKFDLLLQISNKLLRSIHQMREHWVDKNVPMPIYPPS